MKRLNILLLSGWYPIHQKPLLGNFVVKHAESVAPYHDIFALHIVIQPYKPSESVDYHKFSFPSKVIYLKTCSLPFIGKFIDRFRIISRYIIEFRKISKSGFRPDLVHLNILLPLGVVAWLYKAFFGVRYIVSEHWTGYHPYAEPPITRIQKKMIKMLANSSEAILPVSNNLARVMKTYGITKPFEIVANVVDTAIFSPENHSLHVQEIRMIHISTLDNEQKNIDLLLTGFARAKKNLPTLKLHIITDGDWDQYIPLVLSLSIGGDIINHGRKEAAGVATILRNCDFFVLTSNFENLPCVLIESISCGVPVIATDVGGVSEIVNHDNGLIIPPNNPDALTKAIETMALSFKSYNKEIMYRQAIRKYSCLAIGLQLSAIYLKYGDKKTTGHV